MSLARKLREDNETLFAAAVSHPFVAGIGDGSLPRDLFRRWIVQDWLYLQGYMEALEAAVELAPDSSARGFWRDLAKMTDEEEMDLHRGLARNFGLSADDLDQAVPYESTAHYLLTLRSSYESYPALVGTLTPCAVGYARIARTLDARQACPEPDYAAWIKTYMDPAFQDSVQQFESEIDRHENSHQQVRVIKSAYANAARCELGFWKGLWQGRLPGVAGSASG